MSLYQVIFLLRLDRHKNQQKPLKPSTATNERLPRVFLRQDDARTPRDSSWTATRSKRGEASSNEVNVCVNVTSSNIIEHQTLIKKRVSRHCHRHHHHHHHHHHDHHRRRPHHCLAVGFSFLLFKFEKKSQVDKSLLDGLNGLPTFFQMLVCFSLYDVPPTSASL